MKGSTFTIKTGGIETVTHNIAKAFDHRDKVFSAQVNAVIELVYRTARQRRPYLSKTQMKLEGRTRRVSDPNAIAGVPVAAINGGTLQASIKKEVRSKNGVINGRIYTDNEYAKYMEFGTSRIAARPFMRPAYLTNLTQIKQVFGHDK